MKVTGFCEHYSEPSGSMQGKELLGITGFLDCSHRLVFQENTREHTVSETGSVSVLRRGGRHIVCWGP
jgi:hypothetical protein